MKNEELKPGTTLKNGKYKIIKMCGEGTFGKTYIAESKSDAKIPVKICIKEFFYKNGNYRDTTDGITVRTIPSQEENMVECIKDFKREVKHLKRINSGYIVKVGDIFDENGTSYYTMQYLEGKNLGKYIAEYDVIDMDAAVELIRNIANAVNVLHKNSPKFLHLDLSPNNVMITENQGVVLIDFGLAKAFDNNNKLESSMPPVGGTQGYYCVADYHIFNGTFLPQMDIYSIGALFYKILTGDSNVLKKVFSNPNEFNLFGQTLRKKNVPDNIISVIEKALQPTVKNRFQTVDEFLAALPEEKVLEAESEVSGVDKTQSETDTLSQKSFAEQLNDQGKEFYKNGNYQRAFELFKQSADKDFPNAKYNLGVCYEKGNGVEQHFGLAAMWYEDAAKSNFPGAKEKYQKITNEHPETAVYEESTPISFLLSLFYWLGVIPTITGINKCEGEIGSILTAFVINYLLVSICFKQYALKRGLQLICGVGFCAVSAFYLITSDFSSWLIFVFVMGLIEAAKGIMYFTYLSKRKKLYNF